ncbi:hypothetical protein M885DRAFT_545713 [Pelagophyceae sp. CCMP2097]|nr:hypothetical protein M885DRAFT_545713 [Pelagophyceae sp. CCMP2097]
MQDAPGDTGLATEQAVLGALRALQAKIGKLEKSRLGAIQEKDACAARLALVQREVDSARRTHGERTARGRLTAERDARLADDAAVAQRDAYRATLDAERARLAAAKRALQAARGTLRDEELACMALDARAAKCEATSRELKAMGRPAEEAKARPFRSKGRPCQPEGCPSAQIDIDRLMEAVRQAQRPARRLKRAVTVTKKKKKVVAKPPPPLRTATSPTPLSWCVLPWFASIRRWDAWLRP